MKLGKKQTAVLDAIISYIEQNQTFTLTGDNEKLVPKVLLGSAGVGKTTIITKLCESQFRIAICTPTHKAKQVIVEMFAGSKYQPSHVETIHKMLAVRPKRGHDGETRLIKAGKSVFSEENFDLVIIDESSMINEQLMNLVEEELVTLRETPLLMVGDPAQIPPVGSNKSPVFEKYVDSTYHLKKIYRQKKNNSILDLATRVRACYEDDAPFPYDLIYEKKLSEGEGHAYIESGEDRYFWRQIGRLLKQEKEVVYIGYTNAVTSRAARTMREIVRPGEPMFQPEETYISNKHSEKFESNPVETTQWDLTNNEYVVIEEKEPMIIPARELYWPDKKVHSALNSKLSNIKVPGYKITLTDGRIGWQSEDYAHIKSMYDYLFKNNLTQECNREFSRLDSFWDLRLPYALTTHKAQGSAFDYVAIDLNDMNTCLYKSKEQYTRLLYTAMTRARKMVLFYGETQF